MRGHSGSLASRLAFAAGMLFRPVLIVPMAPSGPLGGSGLLPLGIAALFAASAIIAVGVLSGSPLMIALGILTAVVGIPLAAVLGVWLGLPMPWPLVLAVYNGVLGTVGVIAWQGLRATGDD